MTSEVASRDQKRIFHPAVDASKEVMTTTASLRDSIINREADPGSSEETLREGGLTAWLVVLSCFLLNFNLLGVTYAYGQRGPCFHTNPLHDTNYIGVYQAHYLLHQFPNQSAEVLCF